jgi:uncharacterized repeat protein (TIGR01451 family)/uncharacterized delta-60 repeat protein
MRMIRRRSLPIAIVCALGLGVTSSPGFAEVVGWTARSNGASAPPHGEFACGNAISGKKAAAVDAAGNLYVTGCTTNTGNPRFLTIKYDTSGAVVWQALYDDAAHADAASAYALAVDANGNVYVTGKLADSATTSSFATVAYNANGAQLWASLFSGQPSGGQNVPSAIGVNDVGVYVTGYTTSATSTEDYATVKYALSGTQLWSRSHNGSGNLSDRAMDLALGATDKVWVTGYSTNASANSDFSTILYSGAGSLLVQMSFDGGKDDQARAIALDGDGNVFITGYSTNSSNLPTLATVKYDGTGTQQWTRSYGGVSSSDQAYAAAVDITGAVSVSGYTLDSTNATNAYETIRYNGAGALQWRRTGTPVAAPSNSPATAYSVAVDSTGAVVAAGFDGGTVDYNISGTLQWTASNGGNVAAVTIDSGNNVYVSSAGTDFSTTEFNAAGAAQWTTASSTIDATGLPDEFVAMGVDTQGNSYTAGNSTAGYRLAKFNSAGALIWSRAYNTPGNHAANVVGVAVDASGDAYVTGSVADANGATDYGTVKFDADGNQVWAQLYNRTGTSFNAPIAIALDSGGNVYVTGQGTSASGNVDFATLKYDANGSLLWSRLYDDSVHGQDYAGAMAVDANGNVYVTGTVQGTGTNGLDIGTVMYDTSGVQQWAVAYNGPDSGDDGARAIAVDNTGNVVVIGYSDSAGGPDELTTIKYNGSGQPIWSKNYHGGGDLADEPGMVDIDASGDVYVAGTSTDSTGQQRALTIKYSTGGLQQWVRNYTDAAGDTAAARALAVDPSGYAYLAVSVLSASGYDFATFQYDPAGTQGPVISYDGAGSSNSRPSSITVLPNSIILVGGGENIGSGAERMVVQQIVQGASVAGLNLGVTVDAADFLAGGMPTTYVIAVQNDGTVDASGALVQDVLPSNLLNATWTCQAGSGATCTAAGSGSIADSVNLPVASMIVYRVTATVRALPESDVVNTARVVAPAGASDVDSTNDAVTTTSTVGIFRASFE